MVNSALGYCPCGQEIWIEYLRHGQEWRPRFLDGEQREIGRCPDCGRPIEEDGLANLAEPMP